MKLVKNKITFLIAVTLISGFTFIKFDFFKNAKLFSRDTIVQNITREGYLDEVWDFEKVPGENGYYNWFIGVKANDISAARVASGTVVTTVKLNMDYKSVEDYNQRDGHSAFIKYIEEFENANN